MDDHDVVFLGIIHDFFEKFDVHDFCGRIMRVADNQNLGPRPGLPCGVHQVIEKIVARTDGYSPYIASGYNRRVRVNRVGRVRREHHISRANGNKDKMGYSFFGADGGDGFGFGIDVDVISAFIPV